MPQNRRTARPLRRLRAPRGFAATPGVASVETLQFAAMEIRGRFAIPEGIYLLNHSAGAMPVSAEAAAAAIFSLWRERGGDAWDGWLERVDDWRAALAALLGGKPAEWCPQPSVTAGIVKLLHGVAPRPGRGRILISRLDFPSVGFALQQLRRRGWWVDFLEPDERRQFPLERWDAALAAETDWVLITHSLYGNSWLNPVEEILALAKARGIFTVVDVAQSAGVVPLDAGAWGADAVAGSCIKWLCGGPGAGFLWINPARVGVLEPEDVGWFSHENPFEFDIANFRYASDARRFWGGTPSVLPHAVAAGGLKLLKEIGIETVRAHNRRLTRMLLEAARAKGIPAATPDDDARRGGTVILRFKDPAAAVAKLQAEGVRCDFRPGFGVRFSPHIFNTGAEIERVSELLAVP